MAVISDQIKAAEISAAALNRQTNISFLLKDFEKIFDMYIYSHGERSEAIKMFITTSTAPFVLISLFGIASHVNISNSDFAGTLAQMPRFVFLIFSIFGAVGVVPFHRFVAAHANSYKMIRYMNGYRLFYYQLIKNDLDIAKWRSPIEKDPRAPIPHFFSYHWTTIFAFIMCVLNTMYMCVGLYLWDNLSSWLIIALPIFIMGPAHIFLTLAEFKTPDVSRINDKGTPIDTILHQIDNDVATNK